MIERGDPLSAYDECSGELTVGRKEWQTKLKCFSSMKADKQNFYLANKMEAFEVAARSLKRSGPTLSQGIISNDAE